MDNYLANAWKSVIKTALADTIDDKTLDSLAKLNSLLEDIVPTMLEDGGTMSDTGVYYKGYDFQYLEQYKPTPNDVPEVDMSLDEAETVLNDYLDNGYVEEMNSLLRDIPTMIKVCNVRSGKDKDCSFAYTGLKAEEMILIADELLEQGYISTVPISKGLTEDPIRDTLLKIVTDNRTDMTVVMQAGLESTLEVYANSLPMAYDGCLLPIFRLEPYELDAEEKIYVSLREIVDNINKMLKMNNRFEVTDKKGNTETVCKNINLDYDEIKKIFDREYRKEERECQETEEEMDR